MAKASVAHLALGDHEQAGIVALKAATCLEGVYSERFTGELVELRDKLSLGS